VQQPEFKTPNDFNKDEWTLVIDPSKNAVPLGNEVEDFFYSLPANEDLKDPTVKDPKKHGYGPDMDKLQHMRAHGKEEGSKLHQWFADLMEGVNQKAAERRENMPDDGKHMTASLIFRGAMSTQEVDENVEKRQSANSDDFVEWIPNNMKTSVVEVPPKDAQQSCTFIANTTALKGIFQRLATQFGAMYKRKAFLHWYKGEGMDEMEFQEADKNVRDLITEYQDKQDAVLGDEDE